MLTADDSPISLAGLRHVLQIEPDVEIVGEVSVAQDVTAQVAALRPDVVLLDLRWFHDKTAGSSVIQELRGRSLPVSIIAMTAYEELIPDARSAGADAAITREFSRDHLLSLIRTLARRNSRFPVPASKPAPASSVKVSLTPKEREVLELLGSGQTDRSIAEHLGISESTAKNHVQSILTKLGADNRTHAAHLARSQNLLG